MEQRKALTAQQVLQILADSVLTEKMPGKRLKTRKVNMLKAHSQRHAGKVIVIGNTVFRFDKDGNTSAVHTGHNDVDFTHLLRMHGMEDRRDATLKALSKETELKAVAEQQLLLMAAKEAARVQEQARKAQVARDIKMVEQFQTTKETIGEKETSTTEDAPTAQQADGHETESKKSEPAPGQISAGTAKRPGRTKKSAVKTEE